MLLCQCVSVSEDPILKDAFSVVTYEVKHLTIYFYLSRPVLIHTMSDATGQAQNAIAISILTGEVLSVTRYFCLSLSDTEGSTCLL